jgi:hypothetical protein
MLGSLFQALLAIAHIFLTKSRLTTTSNSCAVSLVLQVHSCRVPSSIDLLLFTSSMLCANAQMIATLLAAVATLFACSVMATDTSTLKYNGRDLGRVRDLSVDLPFLEDVKMRNQLKDNFSIILQESHSHSVVEVDGEWISFRGKDIVGIDVFERGAEFYMNGKKLSTLPTAMVYKSKNNPSIMIVKGQGGSLLRATKRDPKTGKTISIVPVAPGTDLGMFITVHDDDIDNEMMQNFTVGDQELLNPEELPGGERFVGPAAQMLRGGHRSLQTTACTSYSIIEIAVVFDSSFCEYHGGVENAIAEIQFIVAATGMRYEQEGLCVQVRLTSVDGYCIPSVDPFVKIFETTDGICGNHADR